MGSRNKTFTQNFEINSLALAHSGAKIKVQKTIVEKKRVLIMFFFFFLYEISLLLAI